jgi:hypothetical protein
VKAWNDGRATPRRPIIPNEWASQNPAFIAQTIRDCARLAETMSFAALSQPARHHFFDGPGVRFPENVLLRIARIFVGPGSTGEGGVLGSTPTPGKLKTEDS